MNEENEDKETEASDSFQNAIEMLEITIEELIEAADVSRVYGEPIQAGDTLIIPAAEVLAGACVGIGYGSGRDKGQAASGAGGGGGGGGRTLSRPVAIIIATENRVRVEPVLDRTKILMAAITAVGFMLAFMLRMIKPERALKELKG